MVSILPSARTPWDVLGQQTGAALQQVLPQALEKRFERERGIKAIDDLQNALKDAGGDINQIMPALAKAYTMNPNLQRSGLGEHFLRLAQASAAQNVPYAGERETIQPSQRPSLPGFMQQPGQPQITPEQPQFFPTNVGPQQPPGNLPQPATTGEIQPLLNRQQKIQEANRLFDAYKKQGFPISKREALDEVNAAEEDKKLHNAEVEKEREQRVTSQREYGEKAQAELLHLNPGATPEQQAIFQKKGEGIAAKGKSEADINRSIALEASKFRNMIKGVEDSMSRPNVVNAFQRKLMGSEKDFNQAASDLRIKLKPLLDEGLYDTARNLLERLGYAPEERETIIHPLSDIAKTSIKQVPEAKKNYLPESLGAGVSRLFPPQYEYDETQKQNVRQGIQDLFKQDPKVSLVLARKGFEDKGYDWRIFKDALNDLVENKEIKLDDDQFKQTDYLDEPPLNTLQKLLHGLNIIGR